MNTQGFVRIAVVGHANTGKTSLIRTLLRDTQFGDVADYSGTTRHVEAAQLSVEGEKLIELYDTPGLEDSVALHQVWRKQVQEDARTNGQKMADFIDRLDASPEFAQEQKVLARRGHRSLRPPAQASPPGGRDQDDDLARPQ